MAEDKDWAGVHYSQLQAFIRDRLRAVECPSDIIDQIGGWLTQGVGASYGKGYNPAVMQKWLFKKMMG